MALNKDLLMPPPTHPKDFWTLQHFAQVKIMGRKALSPKKSILNHYVVLYLALIFLQL